MDSYLVVGVETVVGANLAAYLAEHVAGTRVTALSAAAAVNLPGCETRHDGTSPDDAALSIEALAPGHVILCGPAAQSCWETDGASIDAASVEQAAAWAAASRAAGARFTFISSDAVFTGPWMFHDEEGPGKCDSSAAACIREAEQRVQEVYPEALIVRTNTFGWSPLGEAGWLEQRLTELRTRRIADQDFARHATPILATDLASILVRAWSEGVTGVCHIAGAERISPLRFVQRLAEQYQTPWLSLHRTETLYDRPVGFGAGECSLQTKRIRKAVCVAMPMLSEGLARLAEQDETGYRARLCRSTDSAQTRAA